MRSAPENQGLGKSPVRLQGITRVFACLGEQTPPWAAAGLTSRHKLPFPSGLSIKAEFKEHLRKQAKPKDAHFETVFHIARAWTKNIDTKKQFTLGCIAPLILGQNSPLKSMILKCSMWF